MKSHILTILMAVLLSIPALAQRSAKREFRGAWIHTVHQGHYMDMDEQTMKAYFIDLLDKLKAANTNAVLFQMRPAADAFYLSKLEPVSRYLTGEQGTWHKTPWDPAQFVLEECHKRNMEFHAWLNPYRVTTSPKDKLHPDHIYYKHPSWFLSYGGQIYFDPGQPQCRKFFRQVVLDIATRYDVDAIHMDDYFYPYPKEEEFPDEASFLTYHKKQGFTADQREDWRRNNVDILIKSIHEDLAKAKPWVRFGISPFGIYRNKKSWEGGSNTNGLENYDGLFADVLLWTEQGWIDYLIPQLYWQIGHKAADYTTLANWWNEYHNDIPLYIGQSITRSLDDKQNSFLMTHEHLTEKMKISRELPNVEGNCWWAGYQLVKNENDFHEVLSKEFQREIALIPAYTHIDPIAPKHTTRPKACWTTEGYELQWKAMHDENPMQDAYYYCVYRFPKGVKKDFENPAYLVATTKENSYLLPYTKSGEKYSYYVTVVDRMHNESKPSKRQRVKL